MFRPVFPHLKVKELFMDDFLKDLAIFELGRIALAELQYH